jgi:hypothetical protein
MRSLTNFPTEKKPDTSIMLPGAGTMGAWCILGSCAQADTVMRSMGLMGPTGAPLIGADTLTAAGDFGDTKTSHGSLL